MLALLPMTPALARNETTHFNDKGVDVTVVASTHGYELGTVKIALKMGSKKGHFTLPDDDSSFKREPSYGYAFNMPPTTSGVPAIQIVDATPGQQIVRIIFSYCHIGQPNPDCPLSAGRIGGFSAFLYFYQADKGIGFAGSADYNDSHQKYLYKEAHSAVAVLKTKIIQVDGAPIYLTSYRVSCQNKSWRELAVLQPQINQASNLVVPKAPQSGDLLGFGSDGALNGVFLGQVATLATKDSTIFSGCDDADGR